jgi:hypothetical protein
VEDDEQVLRVLVDLRPLALAKDVLDVERCQPKRSASDRGVERGRRVAVDPGQAVGAELDEARLRVATRPRRHSSGRGRLMRGRLGTLD